MATPLALVSRSVMCGPIQTPNAMAPTNPATSADAFPTVMGSPPLMTYDGLLQYP
jgi:hypothetical protein